MAQDPKLLRVQELTLCNVARKALNNAQPLEALVLIERLTEFWSQSLIVIMGTLEHDLPPEKRSWAMELLRREINRTTSATQLEPAALWARNPKRAWLPKSIRTMLDSHRRSFEPDWDGVWDDPGREGANKNLVRFASQCPDEVFDRDVCLMAANQSSQSELWLDRFLALGGSREDPQYLKTRVAKDIARGHPISQSARADFRLYTERAKVSDVRRFLKTLTTPRHDVAAKSVHKTTRAYALLLYCSCERLEHDAEDWLHIAHGALHQRNSVIQRVAQRGLATVTRSPTAQRVFEHLVELHGTVRVTKHAKDDIVIRGNPIWDELCTRLPVDANARSILIAYSKHELRTF